MSSKTHSILWQAALEYGCEEECLPFIDSHEDVDYQIDEDGSIF